MATDKEAGGISKAYHAVMRDGSVPAIGREAIKDVRSTIMEFFFGKGEKSAEPGTPLNPLFHDIVTARESHEAAMDAAPALPTPSQVIANPGAYLPQQPDQSHGMAVEPASPAHGVESLYGSGAPLPTPSQVIAQPEAYLPEAQQQNSHQQDHGHEM